MKKLILLIPLLCSGCSTVNNYVTGCGNFVVIEQPKSVNASPYVDAQGNTVPVLP